MFRIIHLWFLVFISTNTYCQAWRYNTKKANEFDGKYSYAICTGSGPEWPYDKPTLVINYFHDDEKYNIYLTGFGYTGCDSKSLIIKFDDSEYTTYNDYQLSTDSDHESLFLNNIDDIESFIQKLKEQNKVFFRYSSDCQDNIDMAFSLAGSTSAINKVLPLRIIQKMNQEKIAVGINSNTRVLERWANTQIIRTKSDKQLYGSDERDDFLDRNGYDFSIDNLMQEAKSEEDKRIQAALDKRMITEEGSKTKIDKLNKDKISAA